MNWIKIDKDNLPTMEVLAACFLKGSHHYLEKEKGFLSHLDDIIYCEGSYELLSECTHYIDINKFDII